MITAVGSYATYHITQTLIQNRLIDRSKLLASVLNHSAMIAHSDADLQHVVSEVLNDNADIHTIAIMQRADQRVIASKSAAQIKFSANTDDHLWQELADAVATGEFGMHAEYNMDLVLITPLWH